MAWATEITEKVERDHGFEHWAVRPDVLTRGRNTFVEHFVPDLPTLEAANDKLLVDDAYVSMLDAGAKFALGGADDALSQIVHGAPDPTVRSSTPRRCRPSARAGA